MFYDLIERRQISGSQGLGKGEGWTTKGHVGNWGSDKTVLYLEWVAVI